MSKQKTSSKANASDKDMLDEGLVAEKETPKEFSSNATVSLKEYSKNAPFSFDARNYKFLLVGLAINILGFILMIGGATEDPNQFNANELFSSTRITIAPILIVAGYVVIFYSIMKKNKSASENK